MTSPTFLHQLPEEQLKKLSQDDIQKIHQAEQLYWNHKPYTKFYAAFNGAKTRDGGLIRASTDTYKVKLCTRQISQNPYPIRVLPS